MQTLIDMLTEYWTAHYPRSSDLQVGRAVAGMLRAVEHYPQDVVAKGVDRLVHCQIEYPTLATFAECVEAEMRNHRIVEAEAERKRQAAASGPPATANEVAAVMRQVNAALGTVSFSGKGNCDD